MNLKSFTLLLTTAFLLFGCPTKTTEEIQKAPEEPTSTVTKPDVPEEELSPCPKFKDAPNPDQTSTDYVLYRDFLKARDWDQAFSYWEKVYNVAPAADGQRNTVYADGIRFYQHFITTTKDSTEINQYIDRIFELYDEIDQCYKQGGYIAGRKAFDLYYKYRNRANREEIYQMFKASIDEDGLDTQDFVINPFTALLVEMQYEEKISTEEAQKYQLKIREIIANAKEKCEGRACERWKIIEEYAPVRLESFETVRGFYDCEYYMAKYYREFSENPEDCDQIRTVFSRLKWGQCDEMEDRFQTLIKAGNTHCVEVGPLRLAYDALKEAKYQDAIDLFQKAVDEEEDSVKKGTYTLIIAKIYDAHLKNFPKARQFARKAAEYNTSWGEPYILIGRLYASSGPLCGPGRGWDSQVVVWPAVDMWNRAKRVDPAAAAEANKWIARYSKYMPSKEDVFQRNLKAGDRFRVGCWIQETTTIRTAQ